MRILVLVMFLLLPLSTNAQVFGELNRITVTQTLLRFGAVNLGNDEALDDYLKLTQCLKYRKFYKDDFAMQEWREAMRKDLKEEAASFPDSYYFKSHMYLGTYDFDSKSFPLSEESQLRNVNSFSLINVSKDDSCVRGNPIEVFPDNIGAVLDQPIRLMAIPINEEKGRALLRRMNESGNINREVYVRFSLMIVYAPPVNLEKDASRYNMDAQLLSIEFFEDREMTKPIWVFTRS